MAGRLIAYYRVSTSKQGESGLGLEAQRAAVANYARFHESEIIGSYQEVESGKRGDREELNKAIAHAKRTRAVLVIAKLDRLARNVHFISGLMEEGVEFVACDKPGKDRFMLHIEAAFSEEERRRIAERTKAALAAYKARGGKLGAHRPGAAPISPEARRMGATASAEARRERARVAYRDVEGQIANLRASGFSLREVAQILTGSHPSRSGKPWSATQIKRIIDRAKARERDRRSA